MAAIARFGRCVNVNNRLLAYNAFLRPHLIYCLPVWGNITVTVINDISRTLIRCLQTVSGSHASSIQLRHANHIYHSCRTILEIIKVSFDSYDIYDFKNHALTSNVLTIFHLLQLTIENHVYKSSLLSSFYLTRVF